MGREFQVGRAAYTESQREESGSSSANGDERVRPCKVVDASPKLYPEGNRVLRRQIVRLAC